MKPILRFAIILILGLQALPGCKREPSIKKEEVKLEVSGRLDSVSTCKGKKIPVAIGDSTDSICCIFYTFHADSNKLILKHTDVYFNCCPDSMYVDVSTSNDTINIYESDDYGICGCICKYDLDIEINGIEARKYPFVIEVGPYSYGQNTQFELDFSKTTSGVYCYKRSW
jgi:hypothetical protein